MLPIETLIVLVLLQPLQVSRYYRIWFI